MYVAAYIRISGVPGSLERNIILPSSHQRRAALSHLYSCHSLARNPVCFSAWRKHLTSVHILIWSHFSLCCFETSLVIAHTHKVLMVKYSIELYLLLEMIGYCGDVNMNRTALKYTFVSYRCFINIIPHLILFPWFFLISDISFYLNLKSLLSCTSLCFHLTVSISLFLFSPCALCLNHCVPSQGYY